MHLEEGVKMIVYADDVALVIKGRSEEEICTRKRQNTVSNN